MSGHSPPSLSRKWLVRIVPYVLLLAYSFFISQQPLRGIRLGITIVVIYLLWRFLVAVEAIADALQRFAQQREQDR